MEQPRIISMECSTWGRSDNHYRIKAGASVKYITVQAMALDAEEVDDMPLNFMNILPPLPYSKNDWNKAYILRNAISGKLESKLVQSNLPSVQTVWHPGRVNFFDLERIEQLSLLGQECLWRPGLTDGDHKPETQTQRTVIAKMARFAWEIQYIEAETRMYKLLQPHDIAPRFLGHVYEADRVIGILLEKVEGRHADVKDLPICEAAVRRLHGLGILHGDVNRYNFIIGANNQVTLIDFERATIDADARAMEEELRSLENRLKDESGVGGGFMPMEDDD